MKTLGTLQLTTDHGQRTMDHGRNSRSLANCAKILCVREGSLVRLAQSSAYMSKVGMVSLGCPKNLVDSEVMLGMLARQGYELTARDTIDCLL